VTAYFPSGTGQSGNAVKEPLKLMEVRPPESPEQFLKLADNESPPVDLVLSRPLTTYETHAVMERFPNAVVSSSGAFSDTGHGIVTVTLPIARLRDAAKLVDDIGGISSAAAKLEAHHRERLSTWEEAARVINEMLW
jgi:hypothetical protein